MKRRQPKTRSICMTDIVGNHRTGDILKEKRQNAPIRAQVVFSLLIGLLLIGGSVMPLYAADWEWQNPLPQGNGLNSVWGSSANDVFAVGYGGAILRTSDGGQTWTTQDSGTTHYLQGVWGSSATDVFAVGNDGAILHYSGPNSGFTLSKTTASVNESGTTDTFTVVLDSQPASNVVLSVTSGDTGEATVSPSNLTFTVDNWDTPQTVTVRGVDDAVADGDQTTTVTISVVDASSDDAYDAMPDETVSVTTIELLNPRYLLWTK